MSNIDLLEDFALGYPNMKIGRFGLKAGEKIPLHIHENQFGLAYLLRGKCRIKTYIIGEVNDDFFSLMLHADEELVENFYTVLTPKINAHEIHAVEDCVFLDIFAPGGDGRISDYLEILQSPKNNSQITARKVAIEKVNLPTSLLRNLGHFEKIS